MTALSNQAERLLELAERVEKATGPDRELDAVIWLATTPGATREATTVRSSKGLWPDYVIDETRLQSGELITVPAYTASLDAAMTLVPTNPDYGNKIWLLDASKGGRERACVRTTEGKSESRARTPALALTAAALRARASLPEGR